IFSLSVSAQVVYEPLHRDVYQYLSRLAQKGIIEFDDLIKPVSRTYIAEKLFSLNDKLESLTVLEIEEMNFYLKDFYRELKFVDKEDYDGKSMTIAGRDNAG